MPSFIVSPEEPYYNDVLGSWTISFNTHDFDRSCVGGIHHHDYWLWSVDQERGFTLVHELDSPSNTRNFTVDFNSPEFLPFPSEFVHFFSGERGGGDLSPRAIQNSYSLEFASVSTTQIAFSTWEEEEEEEENDYLNDGYSEEKEEEREFTVFPHLGSYMEREIPLISFEQEFISNHGDLVAQRLYDEGYAFAPYVDGYHNSDARREITRGYTDKFCYIETDSSCGFELIFDRVNLRNRSQARKISDVQNILKNMKNESLIRLSARCGFHVHTDISGWGMKEIESAYHLWNYLEDPIFRLASAFWDSHRDEEVGGGYSPPVPKGYTGKSAIGTTIERHRGALSFIPFLNARGHCRCGAFLFEDWASCTCNLPVPTLEFRVFNATLNQRKIRAYLALCVAFVNAAKRREYNSNEFPAMSFQGTNRMQELAFVKEGEYTTQSWNEAILERLDFLFKEFPLTNIEKEDIIYCAKNSSLKSLF